MTTLNLQYDFILWCNTSSAVKPTCAHGQCFAEYGDSCGEGQGDAAPRERYQTQARSLAHSGYEELEAIETLK